jgi:acyl-CoA thioester hydrolase
MANPVLHLNGREGRPVPACNPQGRRRLHAPAPARYRDRMTDLPYPLEELDLSAPLDRHRATVLPEWIDWNGHMNVGFYVVAFDKATDTLCMQLGVGWEYTRDRIGMTFVLEAHVTYDREVREGDPLRITTQILDFDSKRVHYFHTMHHGSEGWVSATNELILMNIDYQSRRSAPWPAETLRRLERMAAAHARLPKPEKAGRVIAIRRR